MTKLESARAVSDSCTSETIASVSHPIHEKITARTSLLRYPDGHLTNGGDIAPTALSTHAEEEWDSLWSNHGAASEGLQEQEEGERLV